MYSYIFTIHEIRAIADIAFQIVIKELLGVIFYFYDLVIFI